MKYQKGVIQILLIIGIVAALGVIGYVLYTQRMNTLPQTSFYNPKEVPTQYQTTYQQSGEAVAPINSGSDLNSTTTSLDSTDMTQIDAELNALDTASSGF